jgi:hypothetical protein
MRRAAAAAVVGLVFVTAMLVTLPADPIARRLLAGTPLPAGTRLDFAEATLGWRGLTLHDATWRSAAGTTLLAAERLRLSPSLRGWIRDRSGRPWSVEAALCGGSLRGVIEGDATATVVRTAWTDLDLAP